MIVFFLCLHHLPGLRLKDILRGNVFCVSTLYFMLINKTKVSFNLVEFHFFLVCLPLVN